MYKILRKIWNFINDSIERIIWLFNNSKSYKNWIRNITIVIFCIYLFYASLPIIGHFMTGRNDYIEAVLVVSLIASWVRIVVIWLFTILLIPSEYIEPNIDDLPSKIGNNNVIVEYEPPKWLNPSEVWLLYHLTWEWTNLECLIYKREYEKLITRKYDENYYWWKIKRLWELKYNVPKYERDYWNYLFWTNHDIEVLEAKLSCDYREMKKIQNKLVNYCEDKWLIISSKEKDKKLTTLIYIILFVIWFITLTPITIIITVFILIHKFKTNHWKVNIWKITRTEKGEKIYAHIVWYKYFLEHCEEEQMKKILKDDQSYKDKALPYIIALRMSWKFLDREYLK